MKLCKETIATGNIPKEFDAPDARVFDLPEKVLQFGTGVLLRGLPDYYIDKANKQNLFNGRVVVVKSTGTDVSEYAMQDSLYTHCIKGVENGDIVDEQIINASISKVLSAKSNWNEILQYAESAEMQIIVSNTTEVGIVLKEEDDLQGVPPQSFPAKLLAFLYKRYQYFAGSEESGMVIIATELIVDNGNKLKDIVVKLAEINSLEARFIQWLHTANDFCNSLVDRIVPGSLKKEEQTAIEQYAGYTDDLTIMSEPYSLWAVETSSEKTKRLLSFSYADDSVIITPDINKYRELKLRLLNGTHTFSCGLAFLAGFNLVNQAMRERFISQFIKSLMIEEIAPCVVSDEINEKEAIAFASKVLDRFCNPYIEHKWLNITVQYSAKMKMRNVPLLLKWYRHSNKIPMRMAAGFAAYILFMKAVHESEGLYYGMSNGNKYKLDDEQAAYFYDVWKNNATDLVVQKVLANENLWDIDLNILYGFTTTVQYFLQQFNKQEFKYVITRLSNDNKVEHEA